MMFKVSKKVAVLSIVCMVTFSAYSEGVANDTVLIPERAVVLHGDLTRLDRDVLGVFYSRENLAFSDPDAPRFLLIDRQGRIAFGIGGQIYATASYDMAGAIDGNGFTTYDIPVPESPALRQRFGADVSHSGLFVRLVGKSSKLGMYQVYIQSNFTGDSGGYGFRLKQAYVGLGHFTLGLTNSTFVDPSTQAPTVDVQGPSGQVGAKNILFRYITPVCHGFSAALSVENPRNDFTLSSGTQRISQRVPDIPAYIQFSWAKNQHIRFSAIFRDMSYRDLAAQKNRMEVGWGVHLSAIGNVDRAGIVQLFGHVAYGHGIAHYLNDLDGAGYDLVPTAKDGRLTAPEMIGWTAGAYFNVSPSLYFTGSFSRSETFGLNHLGGDTYRYGQYMAVNGFYDVDANFRVGAEYTRGWRKNYVGDSNTANRLEVLLQYSF